MEILELIDMLKDEKERIEIKDELIKLYEYKLYVLKNNSTTKEIDKFIIDLINKYRKEPIVLDYYNSKDGDKLYINVFDNLCALEGMIYNYILRKILIEKIKQNDNSILS